MYVALPPHQAGRDLQSLLLRNVCHNCLLLLRALALPSKQGKRKARPNVNRLLVDTSTAGVSRVGLVLDVFRSSAVRRAGRSGSLDDVARDGVKLRVDALHAHLGVGRDKVGDAGHISI